MQAFSPRPAAGESQGADGSPCHLGPRACLDSSECRFVVEDVGFQAETLKGSPSFCARSRPRLWTTLC